MLPDYQDAHMGYLVICIIMINIPLLCHYLQVDFKLWFVKEDILQKWRASEVIH